MEKGGSVMNVWESVISRSRVNDGCCYDEARLPEFRWEWPKGTWFQARVDYAREHEPVWSLKTPRRSRQSHELPAL
jgi:hypothetical protein